MPHGRPLAALLLVLFAMSAAPAHAVYSEAARWGGAGSGDGRLNSPRGLDVHGSSGNVWVADALNNRIQEFSPDGVFVSKFGGPGTGPGQLAAPSDVAVAPDGTLLVADRNNNRVQRFSTGGAFLGTIGSAGTGDGQLSQPQSVEAIGSEVFVADRDNRRVQVFGADGTFRRRSAPGRFGDVYALTRFAEVTPAIDSTGDTGLVDRLAVIDGNQRVQTFTTSGAFLRAWGAPGTADGRFRFAGAADVTATVDESGSTLYVSDPGNNRIQVFTEGGRFVESFGQDELTRPRGLAVDREFNVYVTETESHRIRKFRFGPPPPEAGESGQLEVARGTVKVKRRGSSSFVELEDADTLPLGSVVDTTKGTIDLTVDAGGGTMQTAEISKGMFKMAQTKGSRKTTELTLQGGSFKACKVRGARASSHRPRSRRLFVKAKGRFRSIGRYSSATVRGTTWTMTDTCSGTLTTVTSGSVTVRDLKRRRNVTVRKGKKYLVRPR